MDKRIYAGVAIAFLAGWPTAAGADVVQFGWKVADPPVDGATRIIDWKGQYTNLVTGASGPNGTAGNVDGLTPADSPTLTDPVHTLTLEGSQAWAVDNVTTGTFEAAQHYVGINEGATTQIDADESVAFRFDQDVILKSMYWQSQAGAQVVLSYGGIVQTNTLSAALDTLGDTLLTAGEELKIRTLSGDARVGAITLETTVGPPPPTELVQFGWKIGDPPLDGAVRIIDWKGQYTNGVTGEYAPNGTQGNFDGLMASGGPQLTDPVSALAVSGTQAWAVHQLTNGTFETGQQFLGINEGATTKLDANESVAFAFSTNVMLRSMGWQGWSSAVVELSYAGTVVTNAVNALYDLGDTALAPGEELVVRIVSGEARISGITVAVEVEGLPPPPTPQTAQTNLVFFLIDDLGWMDLAVQGSTFYETPNIDRLAGEGMRFLNGYAAHPRCLPSRYGLMTGKFPGANGVPGGSPENNLVPDDPGTMAHEGDFTVAEALQAAGYETFFAGKWHLIGKHDADNLPQNQGFDVNVAGGHAGAPPTYFFPYRDSGHPEPIDELDKNALYFDNVTPAGGTVVDRVTGHTYVRTANRGVPGEYVTDRLTDETLDWMTYNADKPMFVYLSHYGVHTPFEAPAALVAKYDAKLATMDYGSLPESIASGVGEQKMRQDFPTYAAMIESVDQSVGRVLDRIDALGIASNTVVVFTSDNGGLSNRGGYNTRTLATANFPLRTGKGWLYEGGIREPFIVKVPGVTPTNTVSDAVVTGTDFYPTLLELAGQPLRTNDHQDGVSFVDALRGLPYDRGEPIFWHSPQARPYSTGDFNSTAVREGDYKLIWFYDTPGQPAELYNVAIDIGESTNLVEEMPAKALELLGKIQAWYTNANDLVFRPDDDDVAKPPAAYLEDPRAPMEAVGVAGGQLNLSWGAWLGFQYRVLSNSNLVSGCWVINQAGVVTNDISLPAGGDEAFYALELELEPEM